MSAHGGTQTQRVDKSDSYDPRIVGCPAQKGTLFRFCPAVGDPILLIKMDDATDTNWASAGGGGGGGGMNTNFSNSIAATKNQDFGGFQLKSVADPTLAQDAATKAYVDAAVVTPTGDPNTVAFFNGGGALSDSTNFGYDGSILTLLDAGPQISFSMDRLNSRMIMGRQDAPGLLAAGGVGVLVGGITATGGAIQTAQNGSIAWGSANTGGTISTQGVGALSIGSATNGGLITANHSGISCGICDGPSSLAGNGSACLVLGAATNGGSVNALNAVLGAQAFGLADGAGSLIRNINGAPSSQNSTGSQANGLALNGGQIFTRGSGAHAHGYADGAGSLIQVRSVGSHVFGQATNGGQLNTNLGVKAVLVFGLADGAGAIIHAIGNGSMAHGSATAGFNITAIGPGSYAGGSTVTGSVTANGIAGFSQGDLIDNSADLAATFGLGNNNSSYASLYIGRYALPTAFTPGAWVDAEPVFVVGNGTGVGTEANAYQLDKDGKQTTTGAQKVKMRVVVGNDVLSARTDYKALCNQPGGGAFTLTLPAGEQGLTFMLAQSAANTATFTIAPTGGDLLDANIQNIFNTNQPVPVTFDAGSGTWYAI